MVQKENKINESSKRRDKTRDRAGVKAQRRDARKRKAKQREFERGDWS